MPYSAYTDGMATKKTAPKPRTTKAKSTTARKTATRAKKKAATPQLLRLSKETKPFMSTSVTRETLYWVVLGVVILAFGSWIMKLQADVQSIYNSIDHNAGRVIIEDAKESKKNKDD